MSLLSDWGRKIGVTFDASSLPKALIEEPNAARIRGLAPLAALAVVRKRGGRALMKEVLAKLSETDVKMLLGSPDGDTMIHPRAWYPFGLQCRLLRAIDQTIGNGDLQSLHEVGYSMAQRDINRVFRPFLKIGKPGWIIELAPRLWRTYQSHGHWEFERTPVSIIATLKGRPGGDEAWCAMFMGWMDAALEMSGAIHIEGSHPACMGRGAPHCVYTVRWEVVGRSDEGTAVRSSPATETAEL